MAESKTSQAQKDQDAAVNKPTADVSAAEVKTDDKTESVGVPTPATLRRLAEDLPEKDDVQEAYKSAMLAETAQEEAQEKVKAVEASPNAEETPSGSALKKVAGESNDTERGEKYARERTRVRWGYAYEEDESK